jgi:membrane protease YdiL (CAAX protease family)
MSLTSYLLTVGVDSGLLLLCAAPLVLLALMSTRTVRWRPLAAVAALIVLQDALAALPRLPALREHHWSWQTCALTVALVLTVVRLHPALTGSHVGLTSRPRRGWLPPSLVALAIAAAVPAFVFSRGSRLHLDAEGWAYLLVMPGLAEELLFRGLYQTLFNRAFGRGWRLAGTECGWGLIVTAAMFAGANGLFAIDGGRHVRVVATAAIAPFIASLVSGWVRERTGSVWPSVFGHNLSNVVIPVASLIGRVIA